MKILLESANSQTLKILPKSYPTLVDVVITDEEANTPVTIQDVVAVTNEGYLDIATVLALKEGKFYSYEVFDKVESGDNIKCIAVNNEYLDSPDQQYFSNTIADLDIEVNIAVISEGVLGYIINQGNIQGTDYFTLLKSADNKIKLQIKLGGVLQSFESSIQTTDIVLEKYC